MPWARRSFAWLYFLGASSALALEVVWTRLMALALGSAVEATACVLGAFMGGLGVGAWLASVLGDRIGRPLMAFAGLQLLGATLAWLPYLVFVLPAGLAFTAGLLSVFLAAIPLGMLFPLAARVRDMDETRKGSRSGVLYALDTAGAVFGCLLAGLALMPAVGMRLTLAVACGLKLLVAAGAVMLPGRSDPVRVTREEPIRFRSAGLLLIVAAQGFCLLGAETVWSRLLSFVLYQGSTTYAFVAMLACVLGFASLGSWWVGARERDPETATRLACNLATLSGLGLLLSLFLLLIVGPVPSRGAVHPVDLLVTVLACGPGAFFSGAVFAAACQALRFSGAARGSGRVLAVNTLAAVIGALLVPLGLVPLVGLAVTLAGLAMLQVLIATAVAVRAGRFRVARLVASAVLMGVAVLLILAGPRWIRHLGEALFYHEGPDVSVAVVEESPGSRRLYVDGIAVAGTDLIMSTDQKTLAHLPLLLHPGARRVLTVGFGSGGTSHSLLLHPDLEVHCAELSPGVVRAAAYLQDANHGLLGRRDPRYHLHFQDARRFLAESRLRFDVIVNDCTDLAYKSDAWLYTTDFFRQVKGRLNPGGIGAAWIPLRGEPPFRVLRSVIKSFGEVFDTISLWVFDAHPSHFGILIGSDREPVLDMRRVDRLLGNPAVRADLQSIGLEDPWRLATSRQVDDRDLRAFARAARLHTDDHPLVEFLAPLEHGDDASSYDFLEAAGRSHPAVVQSLAPMDRIRLGGRVRVKPWLQAGHRAFFSGDQDAARSFYARAYSLSPSDPALVAIMGLSKEDKDLCRQGVINYLRGDIQEAIKLVYGGLAEKQSDHGVLLCAATLDLCAGNCTRAARGFGKLLKRRLPLPVFHRALAGLALSRLPVGLCGLLGSLTFSF